MTEKRVRRLAPTELPAALEIVARAMRDNPLHLHALGNHPEQRKRSVEQLQGALLESVMSRGELLCAEEDGVLVGIIGVARRKPGIGESIRLGIALFNGFSPRKMLRLARWFSSWVKRQPDEPYWHLGPVAVDVGCQGQGIGSAMMEAVCARADSEGTLIYLETDRAINVRFYRRFGFTTVDRATVIGVPNWFMVRPPQT